MEWALVFIGWALREMVKGTTNTKGDILENVLITAFHAFTINMDFHAINSD